MKNCPRILKAAKEEFALKGYGEARVDSISERAGVNKSSLYYHYKSKEELYLAVINEMIDTIAQKLEESLEKTSSLNDKIEAYIKTIGRSLDEDARRHFSAIVMQEIASGGVHLDDKTLLKFSSFLRRLQFIIEEGKNNGEFSCESAGILYMMILGCLMITSVNKPIRERIISISGNAINPEDLKDMGRAPEILSAMVLKFLNIKKEN